MNFRNIRLFIQRHICDLFTFYLRIPFLKISVTTLSYIYEMDVYKILHFEITFIRWGVMFDLGKSRESEIR